MSLRCGSAAADTPAAVVTEIERLRDRRHDLRVIVKCRERDEPDAIRKLIGEHVSDGQRESRLANAAWTGQCDERDVIARQQCSNRADRLFPPNQ